jgi:4-hydroxybenzoate polyprenyltransferase
MSSLPPSITDRPSIADLDRDVLRVDVALETVIAAFKGQPLAALAALARLAVTGAGQSCEWLGDLAFDPADALYNDEVVAALKAGQAEGRRIRIVSRLPQKWVEAIGAYLGIDWDILDTAVAGGEAVLPAAPQVQSGTSRIRAMLKIMRLHQWSKNILIFVPLALTHRFLEGDAIWRMILAFLCFGLVASAIYVLNDMMDIVQDRKHPGKRKRPFASGALSARTGFVLAPALAGAGLALGFLLPKPFLLVMAAYVGLNLLYVFFLKRKLLVDVLALAGGYTLRLLAGNAAGPVELSSWLLAFSMFLFLSLALVKRYVEIDTTELDAASTHKVMGRGYRRADLDMLAQIGVSSGFSAVVVMALYVDAAGKQGLYRIPELIWLICPIILFVIARIWVLAKRREMPDDPVMFIIKDWRSHLMGVFIAVILVLAK